MILPEHSFRSQFIYVYVVIRRFCALHGVACTFTAIKKITELQPDRPMVILKERALLLEDQTSLSNTQEKVGYQLDDS